MENVQTNKQERSDEEESNGRIRGDRRWRRKNLSDVEVVKRRRRKKNGRNQAVNNEWRKTLRRMKEEKEVF